MEKYLGVKLIDAEPERKYLPAPNDDTLEVANEGYKVVYEDGYTSWSPEEVFEKAYRKIKDVLDIDLSGKNLKDYQLRVVEEVSELNDKVLKLEAFITGPAMLETEEANRMKQQLLAMKYYLTILVERIENFN